MGGVDGRRRGAFGKLTLSAGALLLGSSLLAARADAQQVAPLVPVITPLRADDQLSIAGGPRADALLMPLRLSLQSDLFPVGSVFPGCESREDASGNSVHGFPVQRYSFLRLTPELTLHGFSSGGCAVDAGVGGALTYNARLGSSNLWLVPSAGFYALPTPGGAASAVIASAARVDIVKPLAWGRTLSFGVGTRVRNGSVRSSALSFGGTF